jgi:steroid 5-alpha reductase family enzyme
VVLAHGALLSWIGPVVMLIFLFRLTGIPYTERQAIKSRGDRYREYQRTTSAFFPWFPRKGAT